MEIWKTIEPFPIYAVSNFGRVKRVVTNKFHPKERVLKNVLDSDGYHIVTLTNDGKAKTQKVHRLVAIAFVEGDQALQVNHKDGNKTNNNFENLEFVTCQQNLAHAARNGLTAKGDRNAMRKYPELAKRIGQFGFARYKPIGTANVKAKLSEQDVLQIRQELEDGKKPADLGRRFLVTRECITAIRDRKSWTHI